MMKPVIAGLARGNRIAFLLVSVFLLTILSAFVETGVFSRLVIGILYLLLLGSAIYMVSGHRLLLLFSLLLALIITVTGAITISSNFTAPLWIQLLWTASTFLYQLVLAGLLVSFISQSEVVTQKVLFAAVAIYFFLAGLFSLLYTMIETVSPGSFVSAFDLEITRRRLAYFSLVTLTTLGYGDIVPVDPSVQTLATMQASMGTLYIAILLGRFVSLYQHDG